MELNRVLKDGPFGSEMLKNMEEKKRNNGGIYLYYKLKKEKENVGRGGIETSPG